MPSTSGGEEPPEPTPEPSEGLEFFLVTEDDAESMKEILGYYYTPCYGLIGMGTCTDTDIVIPAEYNGLMIIKLSPSEITPSPFVNSAFYQDPDN